jgi:pimeloyl-ACP methyl ester carboxylesterase
VHAGFLTAWKEPRTQIISAIKAARTQYPSYKLVITGHSLGGAVATLAAADLRAQGIPADLFTYGSPRTGNRQFAEFVSGQSGINARVTHTADPVPRLPPLVLTPFRHTTPEYWLSNGAARKTDYVLSDVKICEGTASTGCNAGTVPSLNIDTHLYYFVWTSQCAPALAFKKREEPTSPAVRRWVVNKKAKRDVATDEELLQWMQQDIEQSAEVEKRDAEEEQ